jgi:hypothetical protein
MERPLNNQLEELKCFIIKNGELFAIEVGLTLQRILLVNNWDSLEVVKRLELKGNLKLA